jgi:CRP-like cAMP-binding protein
MGLSTKTNHPGVNRLLEALPAGEIERLRPLMEVAPMKYGEVMAETDGPFTHVYFPTVGVISTVLVMEDGPTIEVGTIGNEGMAGLPVVLGAERSPTKVFCQVPGEAVRMEAAAFREEVRRGGPLGARIFRHAQAYLTLVSQTAACNGLHTIEERLCRWLLMTHDRMGSDVIPLTQEVLSEMLGVRRPSVSLVAGTLQRAGLIRYVRGRLEILDRTGLEAASCECYGVVRREFDRLLG